MIRLDTPTATLELWDDLVEECQACYGDTIPVAELRIDVIPKDGRQIRVMRLCGPCVAEALAIHYGRRHVQAGGAVEDLREEPDAA